MDPALQTWEKAERERSAVEAGQSHSDDFLATPRNVARYFNVSSDTVHPLEYACHLLGDVRGKTILEYGCGDGVNTVLLANRGARIISLDLSSELIEVAQQRLLAHSITSGVDFIVGSAHNVPLPDESVDVVFGIAILHHLDLTLSAREVKRLLKKDGVAIFQEPVRNSGLLSAIRKLIPNTSPDISPFERPLTDAQLKEFAAGCSSYHVKPFTLPTTSLLTSVPLLSSHTLTCLRLDARLLQTFPRLAHFSSVKVFKLAR